MKVDHFDCFDERAAMYWIFWIFFFIITPAFFVIFAVSFVMGWGF